jgi:AraC-like DNA-binding protein
MKYVDILSISELHEFFRYGKAVHPQITVVDLAKIDRSHREPGDLYRLDLYAVSCKKLKGVFRYGRTTYDFGEGSLVFTAPDQVISPDIDSLIIEGWSIYIHPDFLNASVRGRALTQFPFWGYDTHEALHISEAEKDILEDCVKHIEREISLNVDSHSFNLILRNLELFFDYCGRFYDRQFLTRAGASRDIVQQFDRLLADYFAQESLIEAGVPDVKYFASRLHLSANYLSDVLHKYTGKGTQEHVHLRLVDKAKALLWGTERSISEIAYELGFEHPSHFTKLFKNKTGVSPREFRGRS